MRKKLNSQFRFTVPEESIFHCFFVSHLVHERKYIELCKILCNSCKMQ